MVADWYYLDTGEIEFDAEDGEFAVVATLEDEHISEGDDAKLAAARELYAAAKAALIVIRELQRNYIATLQDDYHEMIDGIEAAVVKAGG